MSMNEYEMKMNEMKMNMIMTVWAESLLVRFNLISLNSVTIAFNRFSWVSFIVISY